MENTSPPLENPNTSISGGAIRRPHGFRSHDASDRGVSCDGKLVITSTVGRWLLVDSVRTVHVACGAFIHYVVCCDVLTTP